MARMIAEFGGKFLEWSTVVDAPVTYLMTRDELKAQLLATHGEKGAEGLEQRLARVAKNGTSSQMGETKADLLACNRAGDNESNLSTEAEMVARYTAPKNYLPIAVTLAKVGMAVTGLLDRDVLSEVAERERAFYLATTDFLAGFQTAEALRAAAADFAALVIVSAERLINPKSIS